MTRLSKYSNLNFYLGQPIYQNEIISFAFERALYDLSFDILDPYIQLIVCYGFCFGKLCINMEKLLRPDWVNTTRVAMAGLGSIGLIVLVFFH